MAYRSLFRVKEIVVVRMRGLQRALEILQYLEPGSYSVIQLHRRYFFPIIGYAIQKSP